VRLGGGGELQARRSPTPAPAPAAAAAAAPAPAPAPPAPAPPPPPPAPAAHQVNWPASPPAAGRSAPSRSIMSVCSLRLMRTRRRPQQSASAATSDVLPTPGEPSSRMALRTWRGQGAGPRGVEGGLRGQEPGAGWPWGGRWSPAGGGWLAGGQGRGRRGGGRGARLQRAQHAEGVARRRAGAQLERAARRPACRPHLHEEGRDAPLRRWGGGGARGRFRGHGRRRQRQLAGRLRRQVPASLWQLAGEEVLAQPAQRLGGRQGQAGSEADAVQQREVRAVAVGGQVAQLRRGEVDEAHLGGGGWGERGGEVRGVRAVQGVRACGSGACRRAGVTRCCLLQGAGRVGQAEGGRGEGG
jgi:hypothetical protein